MGALIGWTLLSILVVCGCTLAIYGTILVVKNAQLEIKYLNERIKK